MVNTNDAELFISGIRQLCAGDLLGLKRVPALTRSDQSTVGNRGAWAFIGSIFLLQFLLFSYIGLHRFIDADEGSYLLASRLILRHKKLYIYCFLQPAPPLPCVHAAWTKLAGVFWRSAKIFSALLGTLVYLDVFRRTQSSLRECRL